MGSKKALNLKKRQRRERQRERVRQRDRERQREVSKSVRMIKGPFHASYCECPGFVSI